MVDNRQETDKQLILLIDRGRNARREAVVGEAIAELDRRRLPTESILRRGIEVRSYFPEETSEIKTAMRENSPTIALVVVLEEELSTLTEGVRLPRIPCESISCGHSLIDWTGLENDIYFVVRTGNITGIDVMSMLLSGARGVIGEEALGVPEVQEALVRATQDRDKRLHRLAIGRPYHKLDAMIDMARDRWQIDITQWRLLLALAEIPLIRLPSGHPPKCNLLADEIGKFESVTGPAQTSTTRRKLRLVFDLVRDELAFGDDDSPISDESSENRGFLDHEDSFDLPYLPLYARLVGFPARILPIRGIDQLDLATLLYKGLRIGIASSKPFDEIVVANVTVPRNL